MPINTKNKAVCVPNEYDLYTEAGAFIKTIRIETPNYEVVKLYLDLDGTYYMNNGGWRLIQVVCYKGE